MVYEEIVGKMKAAYEAADAGGITEHAAIQFNISGEGEGAFYIEVAGGKVYVQPYEYYDRDAIVTTNASTLLEIAEGKLNIQDAVSEQTGRIVWRTKAANRRLRAIVKAFL